MVILYLFLLNHSRSPCTRLRPSVRLYFRQEKRQLVAVVGRYNSYLRPHRESNFQLQIKWTHIKHVYD